MSNLNEIGLILALLIATTFVSFYATKCTHIRSEGVTTGILRGVPISIKERWMILVQEWLPMASGNAVFNLIVAVGLLEIAGNVADVEIKILAWLSAVLAGFGCIGWVVQGSLFFSSWLSRLRQAEADQASVV
jgi:hypothetical protein